MKLTIHRRIKIAWEALTAPSGHKHPAQEKQLSTFKHGYAVGMLDAKFEGKQLRDDADFADMGRPLKYQFEDNGKVNHER